MGRFEFYYDAVTEVFSRISEGMHEHSFAIVPATTCLGWRKLSSFVGEEKYSEIDGFGATRAYSTMDFIDGGHRWTIKTTNCRHPNRAYGDDWRFVLSISRDDEEIAHSQLSIEDFIAHVETKRNE